MKTAMVLTGPLGLGHEMMARFCARLLEQSGWRTRRLDSMSLLGPRTGGVGVQVFNRLVAIPGVYDGLHFAHLRGVAGQAGARLAGRTGTPSGHGDRMCGAGSAPRHGYVGCQLRG